MKTSMFSAMQTVMSSPPPHAKTRQRFCDYIPFRILKWTVLALMVFAGYSFYAQFRLLAVAHPQNPHYQEDTCPTCHIPDPPRAMMAKRKCTSCHDPKNVGALRTHKRGGSHLVPDGASATMCQIGTVRPPVILCTQCHGRGGYMHVVHKNGKHMDVDISATHPVGLKVNDITYPANSLPLSMEDDTTINCVTCHDPHRLDSRAKMLRMTMINPDGTRDPIELCHNCHHNNGVL